MSLRISAISFLNTAPLMWSFEYEARPEFGREFEITYTVPSACAKALREGAADIGIIPAITYATIPDLAVVGDVAIASLNSVRSILLISKVPLEQVRTVAADTSSRTSVALTQVLLAKWFNNRPQMVPMAPELAPMLAACDAALVIGDPALQIAVHGVQAIAGITYPVCIYDVAELWREKTGKPFVFAFWAIRKGALSQASPGLKIAEVFDRSRDAGIRPENIAKIADVWASRLGIPHKDVCSYLRDNIHYHLDAECMEGLKLFYKYAEEVGAIERAPKLEFL